MVQEIDHSGYGLSQEPPRNSLCLHHVASGGDHGLVASFDGPILLGRIGGHQLTVDAMVRYVLTVLDRCELATTVRLQRLQVAPTL